MTKIIQVKELITNFFSFFFKTAFPFNQRLFEKKRKMQISLDFNTVHTVKYLIQRQLCVARKFKEFCKSEKIKLCKFFEFCYLCALGKVSA